MSDKIKRYDPILKKVNWHNDYKVEMVEFIGGDYVEYEEIESAKTTIAELRKELEQYKQA